MLFYGCLLCGFCLSLFYCLLACLFLLFVFVSLMGLSCFCVSARSYVCAARLSVCVCVRVYVCVNVCVFDFQLGTC